MKTSIFNMSLTLPPVVELTEVVKEMANAHDSFIVSYVGAPNQCKWCSPIG